MKKLYICTAETSNFVPKELKRAGEELGIETKIIDLTRVILIEGTSINGIESALYYICPADNEDKQKQATIEKLEICSETMVICRLNEYHLDVKLSILKRMESYGAQMLNTPESMALCNDKLMTHVILNNAGIKSPYSFAMIDVDNIETTIDWLEKEGKLKYPIIIKTLRGTHGIGIMKLDSRASLVSVAQTMQKENLDFIIQEFMEHKQSARMIMIGDKLLAANLRGQPKDKDEFRTNAHLGSETEPYEPSEDEIALGCRIVELFGSKFCAIDYLIKDNENGSKEYIVLEVNGSPGLENIQSNWPDKDLALDVVKNACGETAVRPSAVAVASSGEEIPAIAIKTEPTNLPSEVIQEIEPVIIHQVFTHPIEARVDTGAKYSSIHADWLTFDKDRTKFKRGDVIYNINTDRIIKIKNIHGGESTQRAMIRLDLTIKDKRFNGIEFTVNDRGHMKYEVLIGRNVLELLGLPVLVPTNNDRGDFPESEIEVEEE